MKMKLIFSKCTLMLMAMSFIVSCNKYEEKSPVHDWESLIEKENNSEANNSTGENNEPYFEMRGIVASWNDVKNSSKIDYIQIAKDCGINTFSIFNADRNSLAWKKFLEDCNAANIDIEYQEHMLAFVLPRGLFDEHPDYFRMDERGFRVNDANGCPSSLGALMEISKNARKIGNDYRPTNNRYYFWMDDGGDICYCDQCKNYNAADQALIFENVIIEALKEINPNAMLAHLCYHNTIEAPSIIKPADDIFLEFAPFTRSWEAPLSDTWVKSSRSTLTHSDYLQALKSNLKIFPIETAQVLEYWMDVSLFSDWDINNLKKLPWDNNIFLDDINTYGALGIRNISCYAAYVGPEYLDKYKDISFLEEYGKGLYNYHPN